MYLVHLPEICMRNTKEMLLMRWLLFFILKNNSIIRGLLYSNTVHYTCCLFTGGTFVYGTKQMAGVTFIVYL